MTLPDDVVNDAQFGAMLRGTRKPMVVSSPFGGETLRTMREMAAAADEAGNFAYELAAAPGRRRLLHRSARR